MNTNTRAAGSIVTAIVAAVTLNTPAQAQAAPTDPQIVGIVIAANQIDIDYAKSALAKSKTKQVRDFAQQMIADHSALQKSVLALAAKLKVTPAESDTSTALKAQAKETTGKPKAPWAKHSTRLTSTMKLRITKLLSTLLTKS